MKDFLTYILVAVLAWMAWKAYRADRLRRDQARAETAAHKQQVRRTVLAEIDAGRLPVFTGHGLTLRKGEEVHFAAPAQWLEPRADRSKGRNLTYSGLSFSVPIVKGVRYRVGAFNIKTGAAPKVLTVINDGNVFLTSTRLFFDGAGRNQSIPLKAITSFAVGETAIRLDRASGQDITLVVPDPELFGIVVSELLGSQD